MILKRHLLFSLSKQHRPAHTDLNLKKPFRSVVLADHGHWTFFVDCSAKDGSFSRSLVHYAGLPSAAGNRT